MVGFFQLFSSKRCLFYETCPYSINFDSAKMHEARIKRVCFESRGLALFCDTLHIQIFIQQNTLHFCENDQNAGGERVNEHYYLTLLRN